MNEFDLSEICESIFSGGTPSTQNPEFWNGEYNWLSSGETRNQYVFETEKTITQQGIDQSSTRLALKEDIVIASAGQGSTRGQTSFLMIDTYINQSVVCLRANKKIIYPQWLFYNIYSRYPELRQLSDSHSIRGSLTTAILRKLRVKVPPISEQKAIAHILGTLDEKIELNRKMNQTLESMAQGLFKSWFVDFDPVIDNALAQGNPIPEELQARAEKRRVIAPARRGGREERPKQSPDVIANREERSGKQSPSSHKPILSTNPALAAQFPASFVFNETLGKWIPEGWEVKSIGSLCKKIQNGGTPSRDKKEYWNEGNIPWLTSGEVRQNLICKTNSFITGLGLSNSSAKWIEQYSTVIAMYGATAGQVAITAIELTTNQAVCSLIPKSRFEFFNYLNLSNQVGTLENQARGSAQQNISKGIIELLKVVVPNPMILEYFHEQMKINFKKHIVNIEEIEVLTQLRDRLLPELISGRVRVEQFEKVIDQELAMVAESKAQYNSKS